MIEVNIFPEEKPDLSIPESIRRWKRKLKLDCWTGAYKNQDGSYEILLHCDTCEGNIEEVLNHEVIHILIILTTGKEDSKEFDRYWHRYYRHVGEIPNGLLEFLKGLSYLGLGFP